mmetsp:Transcript_1111/g.2406  ORF Transcript_1111/g.2406 Transcript_1111/m.2406 type:complete len:282 (+) Transcript_1111:3-848(+)
MAGYGTMRPDGLVSRGQGRNTGARAVAAAAAALAVVAVVAVVALSGEGGVVRGPLSLAQQPAQTGAPIQYTYVPASQLAANQMPVQYVPVQYAQQAQQMVPTGGAQALRYVPYTAAAAQPVFQQPPRWVAAAAPATTQLRIGGAGVYYGGFQLAGNESNATNATAGGGDDLEVPEAITPPTPIEIAKALQRIQERQIQQQTYHDTLVDAQTGQPLHVPGVSGSAHNGVSGIGGIFGVGGFLGPDYPIADSVQPSGAVSAGPACTCSSCTGSPPVCTGCTCR